MKFAEFSVKHSLFINLVSVLVLIIGVISMFSLRREAFPPVAFDVAIVSTYYPGASAEDVEKMVTTPLEKELKEVEDIDEISSASREGASVISLEINPDATDKQKVINDIQKAVDRVTDLPDDIEDRPVVQEISSKIFPIINIALSGDINEFKLQELADTLKDRLEDISGVSSVKRYGYRNQEFWVEPDLENMRQMHVSIEEIMDSLAGRNVSIPGGKLQTDGEDFNIKTMGEFTSKVEIENVIIRANDAGNWLRVRDVAKVSHTFEEETEIRKGFGKKAITLVVSKKEKGDAIAVTDEVFRILEEFKRTAPKELTVTPYDDLSYYIKRRLKVLSNNGIIGFILVVLILFAFLHPRPAIFTALGIPIAMGATFGFMMYAGITVNLLTMFGLIIVLGMVVDDGIIISENVYRYVEEGMPPREAAIKGTSEVIAPVTATIVTTIVAFVPLMYLSGIIGKFLKYIPLMVIIALSASMLEAFIILPSHLADFVKPIRGRKNGKGAAKKEEFLLAFIREKYKRILEGALKHRYWVVFITIIALIGSLCLAKMGMKWSMFSAKGVEEFQIRAEAKVGTPLEKMNELMALVEDVVNSMPPKYLQMYTTTVGEISEGRGMSDPGSKFGSHVAQIHVYLTPMQQRDKEPHELVEELRPQLEKIKGFERLYFNELKEGPPVGRAIEINIRGEEFSVLKDLTQEVKDFVGSIEGTSDLTDSYDLGNRELRIVVDKEKAAKAFLSVGRIAASIRNAFAGGIATTIKQTKAEEEIKVRVRLPQLERDTMKVFEKTLIPNTRGNLVPLSAVTHIDFDQGLRSITHLDGKRYLQVACGVDEKKISTQEVADAIMKKFGDISQKLPGYSLRIGGEQKENRKTLKSLLAAFFIAALAIFMILATLFNSLIQPFIVMLTIPFALIGVVLALFFHNEAISMLALIGVVGLSGIVVNDSIVLVDFINKLRLQGLSRRDSILQAGALRMRPVLLTTLTTVAGLSTVAYGIGGFDPFLRPMALSIAWGLAFATGLTLIVMPCFYAIIDDLTMKIACHPTVMRIYKNGCNNSDKAGSEK
ncbi:MAG: efflux RND transporter permease subunit [Candidatus Omnitrophica bacterium]|nr:efflux RND transporter permease subunit [Candidatus Omnitrophota bacterium]MBU4479704.1 efflux RND transporter permease subunit [Candidatus Omnitrophota bacterium]